MKKLIITNFNSIKKPGYLYLTTASSLLCVQFPLVIFNEPPTGMILAITGVSVIFILLAVGCINKKRNL